MSTAAKNSSSSNVVAGMKPVDPDDISKVDKVKLTAVYKRLCPQDQISPDDPRYPVIAAEVLDVGRAPTVKEALEVIHGWQLPLDASMEFVTSVRKSFARMKLEFGKTPASWRETKWAKDVPGPVMSETLDNVQTDDKCAPTLAKAVEEAQYVLDLYAEGGTLANEELAGEHGKEIQRKARAEVRKCNAFIKKYAEHKGEK